MGFSLVGQAPKKDKKDVHEDEQDRAFKDKQKQEAEALKAAREKGAPMCPICRQSAIY